VTKIPGTLFVQHPSPCGMHHRKTVGLPRIRDRPIAVAGRRCHTAGKEASFWKDLDIRMELNLMAVFTSREKQVLSRKIPEISSSPLRPDTLSSLHLEDVVEATAGPPHMAGLPHARVRRLGSSYRRDVSISKQVTMPVRFLG
jgi:hypothetical protein